MVQWEYQVVLVNKLGRAIKRQPGAPAGAWQFEESKSADLLAMLAELGTDGWDLIAVLLTAGAAYRRWADQHYQQPSRAGLTGLALFPTQ